MMIRRFSTFATPRMKSDETPLATIGGVGSIRGALAGALLVGMVDSLGRAFLPQLLGTMLSAATADTLAAGLASASIYVLMAIVLIVKPAGLFPARG